MTESAEISGSDRRGFMKGAAVTAAAVGAGVLVPGAAEAEAAERAAAQPFPFALPPVGVDIPCSCYASNVPLKIDTGVVNLDFKGGIDVCVRTSNETGLVIEVIGHKVVADTPNLMVTIEQSDTTITPLSLLQMNPGNPTAIPPVPPFPEMLIKLLFTLTIDRKDGSAPLVLSTDPNNPASLSSGVLKAFPPANQGYTLGGNVPLLDKNGNQAAELQGFPVTVNQSA
ncbi:hypothetical protein J2Z21_006125 [Streptomyces griseochromogenes]|uniref:Twin-arginine translocation signal domain-containing protein n=1 Tax=Streptomyces griseochromogenes TaxID=68214 RepID=A0A1B1AS99_9ACTN|nr:twin-arginine translocation signal domain-containing protein [Streptomyces griseochromogenes]ANP49434.1 hypothetical protein AVL59_07330 [Streptomyces griseochromogenes]MBP2053134.1 hypothetical protein [Streptomyces griseochromogenes]